MKRINDQQKEDVLRLRFVEHCPSREIATRLGMARRTVRNVVRGRPSKPPVRSKRPSQLASFEEAIKKALASSPTMNAPAMLERLRPLGHTGGISVLRDRLHVLRPRPHIEVFSHFELRPVERLEIDWAELGYVLPGGPAASGARRGPSRSPPMGPWCAVISVEPGPNFAGGDTARTSRRFTAADRGRDGRCVPVTRAMRSRHAQGLQSRP